MAKYFLDTYALVEIVKGNVFYRKFIGSEAFTPILNLYELYFILLRFFSEEIAKQHFHNFQNIALEIEDDDIFLASKFKLDNRGVSYPDALGYAMAINRELKFLTGGSFFRDFKNVEFVK